MNLNVLFNKHTLRKLNKFHFLEGWLSENEALGLYYMSKALRPNAVVVEIGSWKGKSTYCLAKGLQSGLIYAIDPFNGDAGNDNECQAEYIEKMTGRDLESEFIANMSSLEVIDKIKTKVGYSIDFHEDFSFIDALYIDGDHTIEGCATDFNLYAGKIVRGGYLAFHDYYPDRPMLGPTHVIEKIVRNDPRFTFYKGYDTLWIARRE